MDETSRLGSFRMDETSRLGVFILWIRLCIRRSVLQVGEVGKKVIIV